MRRIPNHLIDKSALLMYSLPYNRTEAADEAVSVAEAVGRRG